MSFIPPRIIDEWDNRLADDVFFGLTVDPKLIHELNLGLFWHVAVFCVRSLTNP